MKAFLLLAHGSRRAESNVEVIELAKRFYKKNSQQFPIVNAGFLELAEPTIPDVIDDAIKQGATELFISPYFLAAGTHVVNDIPSIVATTLKDHPLVKHHLLGHIGGSDAIVELLLNSTLNT